MVLLLLFSLFISSMSVIWAPLGRVKVSDTHHVGNEGRYCENKPIRFLGGVPEWLKIVFSGTVLGVDHLPGIV